MRITKTICAGLLSVVLVLGAVTEARAFEVRYFLPDDDVWVYCIDYDDWWRNRFVGWPGDDYVDVEFDEDRWIGLFTYDWGHGGWADSLYFCGYE